MSLTKLSLAGNNLIISGQGQFVHDISVGDGKIANLFLQCSWATPLHRAGPSPQATISPLPQATRAMGFWASAEELISILFYEVTCPKN